MSDANLPAFMQGLDDDTFDAMTMRGRQRQPPWAGLGLTKQGVRDLGANGRREPVRAPRLPVRGVVGRGGRAMSITPDTSVFVRCEGCHCAWRLDDGHWHTVNHRQVAGPCCDALLTGAADPTPTTDFTRGVEAAAEMAAGLAERWGDADEYDGCDTPFVLRDLADRMRKVLVDEAPPQAPDLAAVGETGVDGTIHNVTTVADRARWLVNNRNDVFSALIAQGQAAESALRLAQAREARLVAAVSTLVRAFDEGAITCDVEDAVGRLRGMINDTPPAPTATSEEHIRSDWPWLKDAAADGCEHDDETREECRFCEQPFCDDCFHDGCTENHGGPHGRGALTHEESEAENAEAMKGDDR